MTDLKTRRLKLGVTQLDAAIATGIGISHLQRLESGYRPRRGDALKVLNEYYDRLEAENAAPLEIAP
jgi:transcriptional regulator with XRE-family HTH domain